MTTTRTGSTQQYASNWGAAFGEKKSSAKKADAVEETKGSKKLEKKPSGKKATSKTRPAKK